MSNAKLLHNLEPLINRTIMKTMKMLENKWNKCIPLKWNYYVCFWQKKCLYIASPGTFPAMWYHWKIKNIKMLQKFKNLKSYKVCSSNFTNVSGLINDKSWLTMYLSNYLSFWLLHDEKVFSRTDIYKIKYNFNYTNKGWDR